MANYWVSREVQNKVLNLTRRYSEYKKLADELPWGLEKFDDYEDGITTNYDKIPVSPTNSISRKTEQLAELHTSIVEERKFAEQAILAIQKGILTAARTTRSRGMVMRINDALTKNLIYGYPGSELEIHSYTLTKYRRRAIYYIALEMGYIKEGDQD